jgi:hypothetical protein
MSVWNQEGNDGGESLTASIEKVLVGGDVVKLDGKYSLLAKQKGRLVVLGDTR